MNLNRPAAPSRSSSGVTALKVWLIAGVAGCIGLLVGASLAGESASAQSAPRNSAETYRQLDQLMDVFERIRAEYVEPVDDSKLLEGAIDGMLASLDPHSSYLDTRATDQMRQQTEGEYGGLGIEVTQEEGVVKVVAPIDGTPADRAGLQPGDYITHIDAEPIYGLSLQESITKMKGPPNTGITLTIVREGEAKPFDVAVTREVITLNRVRHEILDGGIGYIRVSQFNKQVGENVRTSIADIRKMAKDGAVNGYILDLRRNPGGLLDQAIEVTDAFLARGEIVSQRGRGKDDIQRYYARSEDLTDGQPVIVLVDEASASASEIVAGALQDHRRALVLGQRTFGKGSVQTLIPLSQDTALRLTTARYFTPSGRSVQEDGIEPDVAVPQLTDPSYADRPRVREADLRNHLVNKANPDQASDERETKPDPRLEISTEDLKKQGIDDFQLHYATQLLRRTAGLPQTAALSR